MALIYWSLYAVTLKLCVYRLRFCYVPALYKQAPLQGYCAHYQLLNRPTLIHYTIYLHALSSQKIHYLQIPSATCAPFPCLTRIPYTLLIHCCTLTRILLTYSKWGYWWSRAWANFHEAWDPNIVATIAITVSSIPGARRPMGFVKAMALLGQQD